MFAVVKVFSNAAGAPVGMAASGLVDTQEAAQAKAALLTQDDNYRKPEKYNSQATRCQVYVAQLVSEAVPVTPPVEFRPVGSK